MRTVLGAPNAARGRSTNPAAALGIPPPAIAVGLPLDAVLVGHAGKLPVPLATWRSGHLVQRRGHRPSD